MRLYNYGIQTEDSDIRAHVSVSNKTVYVFPTIEGKRAIQKYKPRSVNGFQPGIKSATSKGWLVKPSQIKQIRALQFYSWKLWDLFSESLTTSQKGELAVQCVEDLLTLGRFPLWIIARESDDKTIQIKGTDIVVCCNKKIQVKCDYRVGETGNLFLQEAERNPFKRT